MQDKAVEIAPIARSRSRRNFLITAGVFVAGAGTTILPVPYAFSQSTNTRRNIDSLHPDELTLYVKTVTEMFERGKRDPNDKLGYAYLSSLHDDFQKFGCEHHWAGFQPWHRAMLWIYEQALQSVSGKDSLALPYWNWSEKPTGQRYPKAFEDKSTILYDDVTGFDQRNRAAHPGPAYSALVLEDTVRKSKGQWPIWGGGGTPTQLRPGSFEVPYHDHMHTSYVGGALFNINTAANDPIFFSFHAFIDLYWLRWQRTWGADKTTDLDHKLRGLTGTAVATIGDVADIERLKYDYDNAPPVPEAPAAVLAAATGKLSLRQANIFPETHPDIAADAGKDEPDIIYGFDITIPAPEFKSARIALTDVGYTPSLSYVGYLYLHPKSVAFAPQDGAFRDLYLVGFYSIWQAMAEGLKTNVSIDISQILSYLSKNAQGENWRISIAVSPVRDPRKAKAATAGTASISALAAKTSIGGFSLDLAD